VKITVVGLRGFPGVIGGIETHCQNLYPRLAELGCEVTILARSRYVSEKKPYHHKGVKVIPLWAPRGKHTENIVHTLLAHRRFLSTKPDIIHFHAIGPALLIPLTRMFRSRIVVTHHGFDYHREKWGRTARFFLRRGESMLKKADGVISISSQITSTLLKHNICVPATIPNGIVIPRQYPPGQFCRKWELRPRKYFLATGRIVPEKNFHDLITAFSRLDTDWTLVIAGDSTRPDSYSRQLKARAREVKNVALTGFISGTELAEIYSNAGCFVLPSTHEGLSISLLEALSYGLPCLVSDIPSNRSFDAAFIRLFNPGDTASLAREMQNLIHNPPAPEKGDIQRYLREHFSWNTIAEKTLAVYRSLNAGRE
jgi:glycosyltransferase involved in cell wall biosynthesis